MADADLRLWAVVWVATAIYLLARHWRRDGGVGLLLAYVLSFAALHWLASAIYLLPWYWNNRLPLSADGLRLSALAMLAFVAGGEIGARLVPIAESPGESAAVVHPTIIRGFLIVGVVMYAVILPVSGYVSSLTALASAGSTLALAGIALHCWNGWETGRRRSVASGIAVTALMPFLTVITQGFLGYGFAALVTVVTFVASFYRPRWKVAVAGLALAYLGLSIYVTYMRDRREIRQVVWSGTQVSGRLDSLASTIGQAEWFDVTDLQHLDRIERRLDQNYLVGAAMQYLNERPREFARGDTLVLAAAAVVPRALWPDKPTSAGSGDLVAQFTGLRFATDTSVGIGQVLECYANFGTAGVLIGFVLIGCLVVGVDRRAARALRRGDAIGFALWFLPGLSLLQIGGSFVEITSTAAAALIVAGAMVYWARRVGVVDLGVTPTDDLLDAATFEMPEDSADAAAAVESGMAR